MPVASPRCPPGWLPHFGPPGTPPGVRRGGGLIHAKGPFDCRSRQPARKTRPWFIHNPALPARGGARGALGRKGVVYSSLKGSFLKPRAERSGALGWQRSQPTSTLKGSFVV